MASSSGSTKVCFNSTCNEALEVPRQGWLCRTGDFADLCDRCASAFKDEKFCDTYHMNASGWRCCESCGKQIHCGCIVSFHMFILLDAGGIECLNCAKTEFILTPNPTWPSASRFLPGPAERIRDISAKNWRSIAGSGPMPWRQAPTLFNSSKIQPEFHSRTPLTAQLSFFSLGKTTTTDDPSERSVNESLRIGASEMTGDRAIGVQYDGQSNLFGDVSHQPFFYPNELAVPLSSLPPTFVAKDQKKEQETVSGIHVKRLCPPPLSGNWFSNNNGVSSSHDNAKPQGETRVRNQLLPCYQPQITDQELQHISEGSNAKITPLFEKVLSASDAGRIGRLVLPKKCAEAYLPPISQPEGYPLVVQDSKGKDWVLQFRFWPNNNSRMYVLEGVTPCIQSMQLHAGDTVTFSRLEPEGKLVMGFRKALMASPSDEGNKTTHEDYSKGNITFNSRNPDRAKRKNGGKMGSNRKCPKHNNQELVQLNITLEQVQRFLQPPSSNVPTVVLIEGVEFEDYQEAPIVGNPTIFSTNHARSLCSTEEEPTPEHLEHINHEIHDDKAVATTKHPRHKPGCTCIICVQPPSGTKHKPTCICNLCLTLKHCHQKHSETIGRNPAELPDYDVILRHTQMGNDQNSEKSPTPSFRSQNIDLNIQPEREEESFPVLDIKHRRLSNGNHENDAL